MRLIRELWATAGFISRQVLSESLRAKRQEFRSLACVERVNPLATILVLYL